MSDLVVIAAAEKLTKSNLKLIDETIVEFSEKDSDAINEQIMSWLNTMFSAIEALNEHGEDVGFVAIYNGPFEIREFVDLESKLKTLTKNLVDTIQSINLLHKKLDEDWERQLDLKIRDFSEDKKNLEKLKVSNVLRRKNWNGQLESLLTMIQGEFDERRESDVGDIDE